MSRHLTVISYPSQLDAMFEDVALVANEEGRHRFARCQRGTQLAECVARIGFDVEVLDLVGHGSPESFRIGDEVIVDTVAGATEAWAPIHELLPASAKVRLLGCFTGAGSEGMAMIRGLSRALGDREVFGTTVELYPRDFTCAGVSSAISERWLISSRSEPLPPTQREDLGEPEKLLFERSMREAWSRLLPEGYQLAGRARPLTRVDFTHSAHDLRMSFACGRRLVLVQDAPDRAPLLFRWTHASRPPRLEPREL